MNFLPKTRLGKWSVGLIGVFFLLFILGNVIVKVQGPRADQTFFDNPVLSIPILTSGLAGILAFFTGILAIFKHKERSVFVIVATLIGLLVLTFVLGEILFPH